MTLEEEPLNHRNKLGFVIFLVLVLPLPANAQMRFNAWGRCNDLRLLPERRIEYCTEMLHSGGGPNGEITVLSMLAGIYRDLHQYDKALALYDEAIAYESLGASVHDQSMPAPGTLIAALEGRAETRALTGQSDPALADTDEIFKLAPDSSIAYAVRCRIRAVMKIGLDKAAADCAEAMKRAPQDTEVLGASAYLHFRQGNLKQAEADCDAALSINRRSAGAIYLRGVIRLKRGDTTDGNADISAAKDTNPTVAASFADIGVSP